MTLNPGVGDAERGLETEVVGARGDDLLEFAAGGDPGPCFVDVAVALDRGRRMLVRPG